MSSYYPPPSRSLACLSTLVLLVAACSGSSSLTTASNVIPTAIYESDAGARVKVAAAATPEFGSVTQSSNVDANSKLLPIRRTATYESATKLAAADN